MKKIGMMLKQLSLILCLAIFGLSSWAGDQDHGEGGNGAHDLDKDEATKGLEGIESTKTLYRLERIGTSNAFLVVGDHGGAGNGYMPDPVPPVEDSYNPLQSTPVGHERGGNGITQPEGMGILHPNYIYSPNKLLRSIVSISTRIAGVGDLWGAPNFLEKFNMCEIVVELPSTKERVDFFLTSEQCDIYFSNYSAGNEQLVTALITNSSEIFYLGPRVLDLEFGTSEVMVFGLAFNFFRSQSSPFSNSK